MKSIYLSAIALCVFWLPVQAQNTANDSTLLKRELTLERDYNPDIDNAMKVNQLPELREPQAPKSQVEFSNYALPYSTQPNLHFLPTQGYSTDISRIKKIGYLTAGVSTLVDFDGNLGILILNNAKSHLGFQFSHRSSNSKVKYIHQEGKQKMKINDNWGSLNFLHNFGKAKLNLDLKYTYSGFNYYGETNSLNEWWSFSPSTQYPIETTNIDKNKNQVNNLFEATAGITSTNTDDLSYLFNFNYKLFNQKHERYVDEDGRKENQFRIIAGLAKTFNDDMSLGLLANFQNFSYSSIPELYKNDYFGNLNYSIISLNPYLHFQGFNWNLRVGIKEDFQLGKRKKANLSPDIHFNFIPTNWFQLDLSAKGGIKENSNFSTFYENRYIDPAIRLNDSRSPLDANLGLSFLLKDNFKLKVFGGYEIIKDENFFYTSNVHNNFGVYNMLLLGQYINVLHEDVNRFKAGFSLDFLYQDIFELKLEGIYNKWKEQKEEKYEYSEFIPYGKPDFIGNINLAYKMPSLPLRFDACYHLETGRKFKQTNDDNHSINDLSLKGTYTLNDTFSFYLKANNLLFQKYEFWYGYPAQNFNIMGGINIKF